ncbi:MAG TPA: tryptophan 2,3-dioxygenase family protein [Nonomuraea sp.]|nr:tryptophan 2,3-dioxygenase family protein [Nonomuraea sp.]
MTPVTAPAELGRGRAAPDTLEPELTYATYLGLDRVLTAQRPRSPAHDETLFIVVHQVYELWFKLLLHELAELQHRLAAGAGERALAALRRSLVVLDTATAQMDVLDTLTPAQFAAFRGCLGTASGAQSAQFRELEAVLGRRERRVLEAYRPGSPERRRIEAAMSRMCVFDSFLRYLAVQGHPVPGDVLFRNVSLPIEPSPDVQDVLVRACRTDEVAARLCEALLELDELLREWRRRHGRLVRRLIGDLPGTGGTSGAAYLQATLATPLWADLLAVRDLW